MTSTQGTQVFEPPADENPKDDDTRRIDDIAEASAEKQSENSLGPQSPGTIINVGSIESFTSTHLDASSDRSADLGLVEPRKTEVDSLITTMELRSAWLADQLPQPLFRDAVILQANEALRQNRFVILSCSCQSLAAEIALTLQASLDQNTRAHSVTFYGDANYEESIDLHLITDGLDKPPNTLMFVDVATLSNLHSRRVVDQIVLQASSADSIRGMRQRLQNREQWVIFYLGNNYSQGVNSRSIESRVSLKYSEELSVLTELWATMKPSNEGPTASEIISQFQGPASHMWGTSVDDRLRKLEVAIRTETLTQKFNVIQNQSNTWETIEKKKYRKALGELLFGHSYKLTDVSAMEGGNAVQLVSRYVLAVITQVDELSTLDFRELLHVLLDGQVGELAAESITEKTTTKYADDGETKVETSHDYSNRDKEVVQLIDVLNLYQDQIIGTIGVRQDNGMLVFNTEAHALVAKECVAESLAIFSNNLLYRAIANSPLLFQVSDTVAMQLCRIYAEHLNSFTHDEKANKLCDFYFQFLLYSEQSNNSLSKCDFTIAIQNANRIAAGQDPAAAKLKADFYQRFCSLLESICAFERSGDTVFSFIGQVLRRNVSRNSELTHDVVLQIVRNLRQVTSVDTLYWLKIVLSSGRQTHWEQGCYEIAIRVAHETTAVKQLGYSSLNQIAAWLPKTSTTEIGSYNNLSAALFVPRLVCLRALERLKKNSHGEVSEIPPFFDLANDDGLFHNVRVVVDLLCRPIESYQMEELDFKVTWNLLHSRWGLRNEEGKFDIRILEPDFDSYSTNSNKLRLFVLLIVLIEATNVFVSVPVPNDERRWTVVKELAGFFENSLNMNDLSTAANLADRFDRNLCSHSRQSHQRRIHISRFFSEVFFNASLQEPPIT